MKVQLVRRSEIRERVWGQSFGIATDLWNYPDASSSKIYLGLATIEKETCDYSEFPNKDRVQLLLDGQISLCWGESQHHLTAECRVARFPGDVPTRCHVERWPARVLNVIHDRTIAVGDPTFVPRTEVQLAQASKMSIDVLLAWQSDAKISCAAFGDWSLFPGDALIFSRSGTSTVKLQIESNVPVLHIPISVETH
ncbi:MAG: HutD family protein [Bdellovibrionota bacterium]